MLVQGTRRDSRLFSHALSTPRLYLIALIFIEVLTFDSEEWSIRDNAAEALGKFGDANAVLSLIQAPSYNDDRIRCTTAKALRQFHQNLA